MLPAWLESSPWTLLIEGGAIGVPYSYFVNFKAFEDHYTFYITDLATIWTETCDADSIKTKLTPYENFLELSVKDLLKILSDMFSKPEAISKLTLQPAADESLIVECGTQLGFVKFNWSFECKPVDRRLAAQHIRSKFTLPALLVAGNNSREVDTTVKTVTREQYNYFQNRLETIAAPTIFAAPPQVDAPIARRSPFISPATTMKEPEKPVSTNEPLAPAPPKLAPVDAELERRKQLESMLAANKAKANDKKRKLI